jgi:hypothetical protein
MKALTKEEIEDPENVVETGTGEITLKLVNRRKKIFGDKDKFDEALKEVIDENREGLEKLAKS